MTKGQFFRLVVAAGCLVLLGCSSGAGSAVTIGRTTSGTYYGFLRELNQEGGTLEFDHIYWYTGAAAVRACAQDHVKANNEEFCHDYYIRDTKHLLRAALASPVSIRSQLSFDRENISNSGFPLSLAQLGLVTKKYTNDVYRFTISQGKITNIFGIFRP